MAAETPHSSAHLSGDSPPGDDDRALLAAHVAGDPDAFATLVARHRDRLWAVALRTTGDPDDAADGLQDGLIAAFRRAGTYRGEAAVTTWLHRVVVNACLDRLRAAGVRRADPLPDDLEEYAARGALTARADDADDPAGVVLAHERRRRILEALDRLSPEQRAAIVLVDLEGYPVAEAAVILDCAVGTVKSRCSRGRSQLTEALRDLLEEPEAAPAAPPGNPAPSRAVPSSGSRAPPRPRPSTPDPT